MENLFINILNMSLTASYVIIFVLIARLLLKKAPKAFSYALWSVVLFRLICPFSFESAFSLLRINSKPVPFDIVYQQTPTVNSEIGTIDNIVNHSVPTSLVGTSVNPMQIIMSIFTIVWLIGIVLMLTYSIYSVIKLSHSLQSATNISKNIYEASNLKTPFVLGVIKPKIYIPIGLSEQEKNYIIRHEQTHVKRLDHIVKPFAFLVLCIHWFNPLVWVSFLLMGTDMEFSCDESVIKHLENDVKKGYSSTLLSLATEKRIINGCPLAFGESNAKSRIKNVLNYKKPTFWVVVVALIAVVLVCVGLMSNPKNDDKISFFNYSGTYTGNIYDKNNQMFLSEDKGGTQISNDRHEIKPENAAKLAELMQFENWKEVKDRVFDIAPDIEILDSVKGHYLMYDNVEGKTYFEVFNPNWEWDKRIRRFFTPKEVYLQVKNYIKSLPMEDGLNTSSSDYQFTGNLDYSDGYGYLHSEYTPKNLAEEITFNWFLDEIKNQKSEKYTNYTLHELKGLTQDELIALNYDYDEQELNEAVKRENLVEYSFIHTVYTSEYSPELFKVGPQFSDRKSARLFLVGKTSLDKNFKIYAFSIPIGVGEEKPSLYAIITKVDVKNNILQVRGLDQNTRNQIGESCNLSCGRGLIVTTTGSPVDTIEHFKVGDKIEFLLFGGVNESYPTSAVTKAVFPYEEEVSPETKRKIDIMNKLQLSSMFNPDWYGAINPNRVGGALEIYCTDEESVKQAIKSMGITDEIKYIPCDYSKTELETIYNELVKLPLFNDNTKFIKLYLKVESTSVIVSILPKSSFELENQVINFCKEHPQNKAISIAIT